MTWDAIPNDLRLNGLWCCWKLTDKGKIPIDALTGKMARSNDKTTFHPYQQVMEKLHNYYNFDENNQMLGGLGLGIFNGFSAIDIDNCRDIKTGKLSEMAEDIIDFCQSYTEISPSNRGIRIIFKTANVIDKERYYINNHNLGLEIYISENTNKYVTITGNALYPSQVKEIDITYILNKYMQKSGSSSDTSLQKALKKDSKLIELWNGKAPGAHANESELDLALCNKLAFYLNCDYNAINNAFISSPYFRSKDEDHKKKWLVRDDYREQTIKTSIKSLSAITTSVATEFDFNDTGNAHRFVSKFGNIIRYNVDNCKWMIWNGKYWQHDQYNNIKNFAELVIEDMKQQVMIMEETPEKKLLINNIKRALSSNGKMAMLKEAEHLEGIPIMNSSFDNDPYLLNCETGIIDLRTNKIMEHNKTYMCSKYVPYPLSEKEPTLWIKFLNEIFSNNAELIRYVQKILGYSITGVTKEQCMFIFLGDGANGKSVLLEIINEICGSYGATSNSEILLEKRNQAGNLGEIARLNGIRNVVTNETKIGDKLNESSIKSLTSGIEKIVARFLYGNEFEFLPIFKIFMATNHRPVIRGTDNGIWRRIKIVPFNVVFEKDKQDKELIFKLKKELPEILNWLIQGCMLWQKEGIENPQIIDESVKEYRAEMDLIQRWIDECCELDTSYHVKSMDLFNNLCNYISINREFQISNTLFGRNMSKKFEKKRYGGAIYYIGIRLKEDNQYRINTRKFDEI